MTGQMLFETCHFLPLPPAPTYRDALTSSCSDLIETVLALHSNTLKPSDLKSSFPGLLTHTHSSDSALNLLYSQSWYCASSVKVSARLEH
ncbi:unnamed protein product [Caenorhabditis sp. 36 PRJEB53466]|nr:unnamed protein product [Caenorhabditis sp. 36 PRJEB53466]